MMPRRIAWLMFGLVLMTILPMTVSLRTGDAVRHMEVMTLVTGQETWMRYHAGDRNAPLEPSWNGRPRIRKPPLTIWLNMLAWTGLTPEDSAAQDLVGRARILALGFVAMALLSTVWMGRMIGGRDFGGVAALIAGANFFLVRQARIASYDTHLLGWTALAVAAGFAVFHDRGARAAGVSCLIWAAHLLAGVGAVMTKGPVALALIYIPLAVLVWRIPGRRGRKTLLLAGSLAAVLLAVLPWYLYVFRWTARAGAVLAHEFTPERNEFQPPWYYTGLLLLIVPWTFALAAGIWRAVFPKTSRRPADVLYASLWFAAVFVLLSIPGAKQQRYLVPIVPAAGLLAACAFSDPDAWKRPVLRAFLRLHVGLLGLASIALPAAVILQEQMIDRRWIHTVFVPAPRAAAAAWGVALTALVIAVSTQVRRRRFTRAAVWTAVWMIAVQAFVYPFYITTEYGRYPARPFAEKLNGMAAGEDIRYLRLDDGWSAEPDQKFLLYARRIIRPADAEALARRGGAEWIISDDTRTHRAFMEERNYLPVAPFDDGRRERVLWRRASAE